MSSSSSSSSSSSPTKAPPSAGGGVSGTASGAVKRKRPLYASLYTPPEWDKECNAISNFREFYRQGYIPFFDATQTPPATAEGMAEAQSIVQHHFLQGRDQRLGGWPRIVRIERYQNCHLWERYWSQQQRMMAKIEDADALKAQLSGTVDVHREELWLWHGTGDVDPKTILDSPEALDERWSTGGFYGKGIYFAEQARYSNGDIHQQYRYVTRNPQN